MRRRRKCPRPSFPAVDVPFEAEVFSNGTGEAELKKVCDGRPDDHDVSAAEILPGGLAQTTEHALITSMPRGFEQNRTGSQTAG